MARRPTVKYVNGINYHSKLRISWIVNYHDHVKDKFVILHVRDEYQDSKLYL